MEVPQQTLLYDPYEEAMNLRRAGGTSPTRPQDEVQELPPIRLAGATDAPATPPARQIPADRLAQARLPIPPAAPPP